MGKEGTGGKGLKGRKGRGQGKKGNGRRGLQLKFLATPLQTNVLL